MRRPLASPRARAVASAAIALLTVPAVAVGLAARFQPTGGLAAPVSSVTPPPPPTFVPTPIGPPPGPPTATPTSGPAGTATAVSTPGATATPAVGLSFSLDAARVSRVHNPGNLIGLVAVKPGSKVWLMMYYTVKSLPRSMTRVTAYSIQYRGKSVFSKVYKTTIKRTEVGRWSRYIEFSVPRTWAYGGRYLYRATLTIGKRSKTKTWKFTVARSAREATTGHARKMNGR